VFTPSRQCCDLSNLLGGWLSQFTTNRLIRIEVAVKQILSGMEVKTNASVANPEALEWFRGWSLKAN